MATARSLQDAANGIAVLSKQVGPVASQLPQTLTQLDKTLASTNTLVANLNRPDGPLITNLNKAGAAAQRGGEVLVQINDTLQEMTARVGFETLPRVNALADDVGAAARSIDRATETFNRNPRSVLFGAPKPAPGARRAWFRVAGEGGEVRGATRAICRSGLGNWEIRNCDATYDLAGDARHVLATAGAFRMCVAGALAGVCHRAGSAGWLCFRLIGNEPGQSLRPGRAGRFCRHHEPGAGEAVERERTEEPRYRCDCLSPAICRYPANRHLYEQPLDHVARGSVHAAPAGRAGVARDLCCRAPIPCVRRYCRST